MKKGTAFELAVATFVKKIAPDAKVYFDHKIKDRDTGSLRQVDVWIETRIANHYPLSILISCKDYKRKLNISHIGTFINEVRSTGASTGVIYSKSGFTKPAILKAKANGLSCCRLYENQPADCPEVVLFTHYISKPTLQPRYLDSCGIEGVYSWGDLLDLGTFENRKVYDELLEDYREACKRMINEGLSSKLPSGSTFIVMYQLYNGGYLKMALDIRFRHFRGKISAHIVDGSYCLDDGKFHGKQSGPVIDTQSVHPGPGWEEIPWTDDLPPQTSIMIFGGGLPIPDQLQKLRSKRFSV